MDEEQPFRDPPPVVAAAFLLALVCALLPLAYVGAVFAGVALVRRGRRREGVAVVVLGLVCVVVGGLIRTA
jgi:hypothetical protein